jgi:hypothetical protein
VCIAGRAHGPMHGPKTGQPSGAEGAAPARPPLAVNVKFNLGLTGKGAVLGFNVTRLPIRAPPRAWGDLAGPG